MKAIPRAFLLAWLVCAVLGVVLGWRYHPRPGRAVDFQSLRAAGYQVIHDPRHLYDLSSQHAAQGALDPRSQGTLPFFHLSYEALLYAPFSWMSYQHAYAASIAANFLLLLASFLVLRQAWPLAGESSLFAQFAPLLLLPVYVTIFEGQDSLVLLLVCCLVLRALVRGQDARAGAVLALALFKFELALPLLALLAVRRGWRLAAGFAPVAAVLLLGSFALVGAAGWADLRRLVTASTLAPDARHAVQAVTAVYPALMPNLMGLVFTSAGSHLRSQDSFLVAVLVSALAMAYSAWRIRSTATEADALTIAVLGAILVSYHLYLHDACLLLLPLWIWSPRRASHLLLAAPLLLLLLPWDCVDLLAIPIGWLLLQGRDPSRRVLPAAIPA